MPSSPEQPTTVDAWTTASITPGSAPSKSTTVVFVGKGPLNEDWMKWMELVSKDEKKCRTVFLECEGDSFRTHTYSEGKLTTLTTDDLKVAKAAVANKFPAFRNTKVSFLTKEESHIVKIPSTPRVLLATKILTQQGLEARIKRENIETLDSLVEQLRTPLGVIPFIGAGMSAAIKFPEQKKFPQWGELLEGIAEGRTIEPKIKRLIEKGDYERAAHMLDEDCPNFLPSEIKDAFDRDVNAKQVKSGALSYLPFLTRGPVITTNFDRVLERVFEVANKRLDIISGPKPYEIASAIQQNKWALLKIHGDCRDSTFRVLTVKEYEAAYGGARSSKKGPSIGSLAWLMFTNRPLLCLGCSLETDRTTHVLRALKKELPGLTHYAILARNYSLYRWEQRENQLREMGVRPLWYAPEKWPQIESLLNEALERSSTCTLSVDPVPDAKPALDRAAITEAFCNLGRVINAKSLDHKPKDVLQTITQKLLDGKLAFFLGSQAHLGKLPMGDRFYRMLAKEFDCPALGGDRGAVAAYITSQHGTEALWTEIKKILSPVRPRLSAVHQLIAALPNLMRATNRKNAAPLWIFTTNYDTVMEQALIAAREPFHLLYHIGGTATEYYGLFFERSADGVLRLIERPENMRYLDPQASVIVKLNGGLVHDGSFAESVLVATGHFERFAAAIPNALPLYLRDALRDKSLLFFGHGLAEPDVQALIEYSSPGKGVIKSWAVQRLPDPEWRPAWEKRRERFRSLGLQTVVCDLRNFLGALHERWVDELCPPSVNS